MSTVSDLPINLRLSRKRVPPLVEMLFGRIPFEHHLCYVGASLRDAMLATNSGLTKLILYQYVVRTDRDLTNYVKWWNSII